MKLKLITEVQTEFCFTYQPQTLSNSRHKFIVIIMKTGNFEQLDCLPTCSYDTSITPSLSTSSLLKDSVNDLSIVQH